jgi:hypothetical protein
MGIGAQRINLAAMLASSRVIALAAAPEHDQVLAEPGLVPVVAEREPAAESLAIGQAAARARVIVRGAVPVLAIVLAEALVLIIAPAEALVLAIVPAEVQAPVIALAEVREPETVQVEAVPVRSHLRARLAVPLRIKSVTGPRRHDQVLLLTVEDLAAGVAVTTREPVAAEVVKAWAAAE